MAGNVSLHSTPPGVPTPFVKRSTLAPALRFLFESNGLLLGAGAFLFAVDLLVCCVSRLRPPALAFVLVLAALRAVLRGFLRPGYLRALEDARRGDETSVDTLTSGLDVFENALVAHVISDVVIVLSLAAGAVPGLALVAVGMATGRPVFVTPGLTLAAAGSFVLYLYAYLGVRFAETFVALERLGPFASVSRAWTLARGKRLRIARVVVAVAALELGGLVLGVASFGIGIFIFVPYTRLAGDHAMLGLFAELQAEEPATKFSSPARFGFIAARGASLPEYALLIVAIVLIAGGAYRSLGRSVGNNANRAAAVLLATGGGGGGGGGAGGAAAAGGGGLAGFFSDFVDGIVKGDFSDRQGAGRVIGQVVGGFIPIVGQISDIRDAAAAVGDIAKGKEGGWSNLGLAAVGFVPGVGDAAKAAIRGGTEAAAAVAKNGDEAAAAIGAVKRNSDEAAALAKVGDLRPEEVAKIQQAADTLGQDIYVLGSAAKGERRGVGTDLPLGQYGKSKAGTRSDIDYAVKNGHDDKADALGLPDVDGSFGVRGVDYINLNNSPAIKFSPGKPPEYLPQGGGRIPL
jgi:hypothetical protein